MSQLSRWHDLQLFPASAGLSWTLSKSVCQQRSMHTSNVLPCRPSERQQVQNQVQALLQLASKLKVCSAICSNLQQHRLQLPSQGNCHMFACTCIRGCSAATYVGLSIGMLCVHHKGEACCLVGCMPKTMSLSEAVRVATIDNFQGEESTIVILSLVRNNRCNYFLNACLCIMTTSRITTA